MPKKAKTWKRAKNSQKRPKKGLFWGFLKYMVNRPTFLYIEIFDSLPGQKGPIFGRFLAIFHHF
jgi:hypothetical protein